MNTRALLVRAVDASMLALGLLALAGALGACGPQSSGSDAPPLPPMSAPVVVPGGSVSCWQGMPADHVASVTSYVAAYLAHWGDHGPISVSVVPGGTPYRILGPGGGAVVADLRDGTVGGVEWEVPLYAQNADDPPAWTWGNSGPLFSGQAQWAVDRTNEPLSVRHAP